MLTKQYEQLTHRTELEIENDVIDMLNEKFKRKTFDVNIDGNYFDTSTDKTTKVESLFYAVVHNNDKYPEYVSSVDVCESK